MTPTKEQTEPGTNRRRDLDALAPEDLVALLVERSFDPKTPPVSWAASEALATRGKAAIAALLTGLEHADAKVRATCALLLDHVADDRCIGPLLQAMRLDAHEAVRRCAMHALVCDGCKECPLNTDVVGALIESARSDRSRAVRRRAVFYLSQQRPDARTGPALEALLADEADPILRRRAQRALAGLAAGGGE